MNKFSDFTLNGAATRPSPSQPLPRLSRREVFTMPETKSSCVNCKRSLKHEPEFSQSVAVCRECLKVYSLIDSRLNEVAERKAVEVKRRTFTEKLNF